MDEAECTKERFIHPWFKSAVGVPPAKLWMITSLPLELFGGGPFAQPTDPAFVSPLGSQPIVEVCLRIATHLTVNNGCDRAVARSAFLRDLPKEILTRASKGSPGPWMRTRVKQNRQFVREFLLDGLLVREGLLDKHRLAEALADQPTKSKFHEGVIIKQMYNEAWLRSWMQSDYATAR
jgi:asparagine synthase (glutamine-hydrolysing)